ncbi:putative addiction module antidote protein [Dyella sp. M7H15-1]|uniref:addiction module antidote protein n=1 Tax=Dyella sp. M7H15-1 TaxID=2501295 RepID=UPI001004DB34|nr:addiction module antidote protein [Dyella sp. M7H15-1]QAU22954.1 putative addiction module antidote protein [Dyella sp. M7H15-1]
MTTHITPFDAAEYLDNEKVIAAYIKEVMETGDYDLLLSALGDVAKARGMTDIAKASGLSRESLYKAVRPGSKPQYETVDRIIHALGLKLTVAVA